VLDLGMLNSFTHQLKTLGCNVTMLPYDTDAASILEMRPDGLVISNGPEDGAAMDRVADTVRSVLGKIPLFGIATGHQVIGIALGGKIKKMKVGHHGVNYPVRADNSFKGAITVQNHSFVLDDNSIKNKKSVTVTLRNVNDRTIEAMESKTLKFISVQYYPSSPGFDEANEAFARFVNMAKPSRGTRTRKIPNASNEVTYAKA
jgi:carbamoyl-phosphate synthase small subunit